MALKRWDADEAILVNDDDSTNIISFQLSWQLSSGDKNVWNMSCAIN